MSTRYTPDEEMKERICSGILEFFMQHIHKHDLLNMWEEIAPNLRELVAIIGEDYIKLFLSYTLTGVEKNDTMKLKELSVHNLSEEKGQSALVSFAQHYFDEGKIEAAVNMIKYGMDIGVTSKITGVPLAKLRNLTRKLRQ